MLTLQVNLRFDSQLYELIGLGKPSRRKYGENFSRLARKI